jgi:ketosteroid isomerase-like protein
MLPNNNPAIAIPIRIFFILLLCCLCLALQSQETKTTTKGPTGKDLKVKKEPDKLKIKGEGAGSTMLDLDAVKKEIAANNAMFDQAINAMDSAAMVSLYHSEAKIYPQGMNEIMREQMGGMTRMLSGMGIKNAVLTTSEVIGSGDVVVETGTFEMKGENSMVMDSGKYIVVWKKQDGKWKIYRDMWNSNSMPHQ